MSAELDLWARATRAETRVMELKTEVRSLQSECARLKTVPMKYRRMAFNAQLQEENNELRVALAGQSKRIEELEQAAGERES